MKIKLEEDRAGLPTHVNVSCLKKSFKFIERSGLIKLCGDFLAMIFNAKKDYKHALITKIMYVLSGGGKISTYSRLYSF